MIIVRQSERGQGIGCKLMSSLMDEAGDRELRLVATKAGVPLYEKLGFESEGEIFQCQGEIASVELPDEEISPARPGDTDAIIAARGLKQVSDSGELAAMVDAVIEQNPDQVAQYLAADEGKRKKLSGFFVGQIMKASKGQANPKLLNELLLAKLNDQS